MYIHVYISQCLDSDIYDSREMVAGEEFCVVKDSQSVPEVSKESATVR
jgi:hypothetical protein